MDSFLCRTTRCEEIVSRGTLEKMRMADIFRRDDKQTNNKTTNKQYEYYRGEYNRHYQKRNISR